MKVLFLRSARNFSGVERYNENLLAELQKYFDVTLLTNLEYFQNSNFPVRIEKWLMCEVGTKKQLLKAILLFPIFLPKYINLLIHYDIICLQSRTEMIFLSPILCLIRKKIVWIQHGPLFVSQAAGIVKALFVYSSRCVDRIIAVSQNTKRDLVRGGIENEKIVVIYIGVTLPKREKMHQRFTVGFLGTVTKEKGIEDFIAVTRGFATNIVGDGPDKYLIPQATGFVQDVDKYLKKVNVLVLPTHHHEGVSMAILEAQAMGIPVITTDIGGNKEIIRHGYNGFLYRVGNVVGMRRSLQRLSTNITLRAIMGLHARKTIERKFFLGKQAKKFVKFFTSL